MFMLIFRPTLIRVLLGWDGLGVTSFLLVIYFFRKKSLNAGLLTALTNRIGDCLILRAIALWAASPSWAMPAFVGEIWLSPHLIIIFTLIVAAFTKRAQVPFSAWLPAAIAAPTPVSSLVHSSTLVTAGVYLLIRFSGFLENSRGYGFILPVGLATMIMAGASALAETDMKKVVALSTLSQLGLMISTLGIGRVKLTLFHLLTHAFFKALLFMSVGHIIHMTDSYQDFRQTANPAPLFGPTALFRLLANFRLIGFPFLAGFYSKDLIIESSTVAAQPILCVMGIFLGTLLTAAYTTRFLITAVIGINSRNSLLWLEDNDGQLATGNSILAPGAIMVGSIFSWGLLASPVVCVIPSSLKLITIVIIVSGIGLGLTWFNWNFKAFPSIIKWSWGIMWSIPWSSSLFGGPVRLQMSNSARFGDLTWNLYAVKSPTLESSVDFIPTTSRPRAHLRAELFLVGAIALTILLW